MSKKTISVPMSLDLHATLEQKARERGISLSCLIREIVGDFFCDQVYDTNEAKIIKTQNMKKERVVANE